MNKNKKVILGLSGGVDSSVCAYLLKQQGYQVEALFMKNWEEDDDEEYCLAAEDLKDAQAVCDKLSIPLHTINFASEYWDNVFEYFLSEYSVGRTPNPDILCNKEIKFKAFLEYAQEVLNADYIAMGHYVRKKLEDGKYCLLQGLDSNKDQSYFLYTLSHQQIAKSLFPIGELEKHQVREIAAEQGLITANKKDSTGICFIGERKFKDFLERFLPAKPGNIEDENGQIIGKHQGLMYHTLGQRKGLHIGGLKGADETPWYVAEKDLKRNVLIAVQGANHALLTSTGFIASQLNWVSRDETQVMSPLLNESFVKIRYRQQAVKCSVIVIDNDTIQVNFENPQTAITPGQSAVFYYNDICLGGGVIDKRIGVSEC